MFIAALFTIAKIWKQPKWSSIDEWIKKWYTYTMEYYSAIEKKWNLAICDNMMDLKHIMLSEISQTEKDKYCMLSHMQNLKKLNKQAKWNENRFIDAENKGVLPKVRV